MTAKKIQLPVSLGIVVCIGLTLMWMIFFGVIGIILYRAGKTTLVPFIILFAIAGGFIFGVIGSFSQWPYKIIYAREEVYK